MNNHAFKVEHAEKYGVNGAIILFHIEFWLEKNAANNRNIHEGKVWTYSSVSAFEKLFPYWSKDQIRRILKSLEDAGAIESHNFNKSTYDRTKWYTSNAFDVSAYSISQKPQFDVAESPNGLGETTEPIPDTNTDTKTDIETDTVSCAVSAPEALPETNRKSYPETFEAFWSPLQATKAFHVTPLGTKAEAFNEWERHAKHIPPDDLRLQWMAYLTQCRRTDTNTKHVCRWLKYHGFEDDYGPPVSGADQVKAALQEKWRREDERDEAGNLRIGNRTAESRLHAASQSRP